MAQATAKSEDRRSSVGTSSRKVDGREKVRGEAKYISDFDDPDLLHGAVVRSNRPHARVVSVDATAAEDLSGVHSVVSRTDLLGEFDDKVRHYGDVVAAVVAEDQETAERAAKAVEVDLEPLDAVFDPREAVLEAAPTVQGEELVGMEPRPHSWTIQNDDYVKNIDDYHHYEVGDVEDAMDQADVVLEKTYRTPRVNHCNLDTHCCVADWSGDHLTITETLTSPHPGKESLCDFLGLDDEQLTIQMPPAGSSSFGGQALPKLTLEPVAATLADLTDRPVKLWFDREEDFIATETRHAVYYTIKMGISSDGRLQGIDISAVADTGAYPNHIGHVVLSNGQDRVLEIYDVPHYRFEGVSAFTNNVVAGEYRGIGSTQLGFALESHVDELCRTAEINPETFRRKNFIEEGFQPPHLDAPIDSCGLEECLDRGLDTFERNRHEPANDPDTLYGWGFASATHTTGSVMPGDDIAEVQLDLMSDGSAVLTSTAIDQGQGSDTALSQIVNNETGLPTSQLEVSTPSTADDIAADQGSIASRTTWIVGSATLDAAAALVEELSDRAAGEVERIDGDELVLRSGRSIPITDLLNANEERLRVNGRAESSLRPPGYGVHFAEVAVDAATGRVDVQTYVAAQDVGFAINPALVEGQLEGAVLHGIESALFSELQLERGNPQNANLADYPVISPWEMPDPIACELIESKEESGPYGAKGVGTPAMPPVAPAILNALRDATGTRFTDIPVNMETVFDAVGGEDR